MLNENIKKMRQELRLSQTELAKELGVSKQCVSNWENDNVQPSIEMLVRIARYFGCSTDALLGLTREDTLDVSGLDQQAVAHLKLLISDLKQAK